MRRRSHSPIEHQVLDCFKSLLSATETVGGGGVGDGDCGDDASCPEAPTMDLSLTLAQLGGDSLAATRLSFLLQESFSVSVSASELLSVGLGEVLKQVRVKKGLPASLPSTAEGGAWNKYYPVVRSKYFPVIILLSKILQQYFFHLWYGFRTAFFPNL